MGNRQTFDKHDFRIGVFDIKPTRNIVSRNGEIRSLEPRIMDVLCVLASEPDEVHTRESLIERIWQIEYGGDESLTRAIGVLRKTFRDSGEDVVYIETITKRGYRLTQPVTILEAASRTATSTLGSASGLAGNYRRKRVFSGFAALFVILAAVLGYFMVSPNLNQAPADSNAFIGEGEIEQISIAVLPFDDFSESGDQEYFADGIAEEILHLLVKSPELKVAGRTSSFQFKDKTEDLRMIGESLNVAHILEGSIRKSGDELRITAQLIRSSDGFHIWSETYDGDVKDIFTVQENIAGAIASALETSLGISAGSQAKARTDNPEAYEHYLRGLGDYAMRDEHDITGKSVSTISSAIDSFEKAVALDPDFAAAWAGLSLSYVVAPKWLKTDKGYNIPHVVYHRKALYAASRAVELNPDLAVTQHALANILMQYWQWERAEDALLKALSMEPNSHVILEDYREFLSKVGRLDEAVIVARKMIELEPQNIGYLRRVMEGELMAGNREFGFQRVKQYLALIEPNRDEINVLNLEYIARNLHFSGNVNEAFAYVTNCSKCSPEAKAYVLALLEQTENPDSGFQIEALKFKPTRYFTILTGNVDIFIENLEHDFALGKFQIYYPVHPNFGIVASDPRYKSMTVDSGLHRYWLARGWPKHCRPVGDDDFECGAVKEAAR